VRPLRRRHNAHTGIRPPTRHAFSKGIHLIVPIGSRPTTACSRSSPTTVASSSSSRWVRAAARHHRHRGHRSPETRVTAEDRRFVLDNINKRLKLDKPLTAST
jgi:glycerol-3-phosphate dehydrogenase